jgi:hypothetical protein
VLDTLRRNFDYVIIDTPALSTCNDGALIAALGDGALMLARMGSTRTAELRRALEALQTAHAELIGTALTRESGHGRELASHRKESADRGTETETKVAAAATPSPATVVIPAASVPALGGTAGPQESATTAIRRPDPGTAAEGARGPRHGSRFLNETKPESR